MNNLQKIKKIFGLNWLINFMEFLKLLLSIAIKKKFNTFNKDICEDEFMIRSTPTVYAFSSNIDHDPVRFNGIFNEVELANFAV